MNRKEVFQTIRRSQSGIATLEAAILVFTFTFICIGVFEVGRGLETYYRFVQVARDSVRIGSWLGGIQRGNGILESTPFRSSIGSTEQRLIIARQIFTMPDGETAEIVGPASGGSGFAEHLLIHDRATALTSLLGERIEPNSLAIRTSTSGGVLNLDLYVNYKALLPVFLVFRSIPLHVHVTGPLANPGTGLQLTSGDVSQLASMYTTTGASECQGECTPPPPVNASQLSNGMWVGLIAEQSAATS